MVADATAPLPAGVDNDSPFLSIERIIWHGQLKATTRQGNS
jgi:hypothetical protein